MNGPGLTKLPGYALATTLYHLSDILQGREPWINSTTTCTYPLPWLEQNTTESNSTEPSVVLTDPEQYTGRFGNPFITDIVVKTNAESPRSLLFEAGRIIGILQSTRQPDRFLMEITQPWEFVKQFIADDNSTIRINCTFSRIEGLISSMTLETEVNVVMTKDFNILDSVPQTSSGPLNNVASLLVAFTFVLSLRIY